MENPWFASMCGHIICAQTHLHITQLFEDTILSSGFHFICGSKQDEGQLSDISTLFNELFAWRVCGWWIWSTEAGPQRPMLPSIRGMGIVGVVDEGAHKGKGYW